MLYGLTGQAGTQSVELSTEGLNTPNEDSVLLDVRYTTSDDNPLARGVGFRLYYNSRYFTPEIQGQVYPTGLVRALTTPQADSADEDLDSNTDSYLEFLWQTPSDTWPGGSLPLDLFRLKLTVSAPFRAEGKNSTIALIPLYLDNRYGFHGRVVSLRTSLRSIDIDGDGESTALVDGLMILRYLFGLRGDDLIGGAITSRSQRTLATQIEPIIAAMVCTGGDCSLDVDGNGETTPKADGRMLVRGLFGLRGEALVREAIGPTAPRDAGLVNDYIQAMRPGIHVVRHTADTGPDFDADGIPNRVDPDLDGDGHANDVDFYPEDPARHQENDPVVDLDQDGIPDYLDIDRDGDGHSNDNDHFPDDPARFKDPNQIDDLDQDGIPDDQDDDRDGDGVGNDTDLFPDDPAESSDLDQDGIGDHGDPDRDGDQVRNTRDLFPDDPLEHSDLDGDGVGDNTDPDRDGDGVANADDFFPDDPSASTVPTVTITSPASLITVGSSPITVIGTIDDPNAHLVVNGVPVNHSGGNYTADVVLEEGANHIVVRAIDARNHQGTATVSVSLDKTPPYVTVQAPADGATVYTQRISVSGLVNDIVRGTVAATDAIVEVNGVQAQVTNRSYLAENIPLQEGENSIHVTASDAVGNIGSTSTSVTYRPPAIERLIGVEAGQGQSGEILTPLAAPLAVKLTSNGVPVADQTVTFRVIEGDGHLLQGAAESQGAWATTGADGIAGVEFRLGSRAGKGIHRVRARAAGFDGEAIFHASATPRPGDKLGVIAGNNQRGAVRQPLPEPLVVAVTDAGTNLVEGAEVEFEVMAGGGAFANGAQSYRVSTDKDGRASAHLTLGADEGVDSQAVVARLTGTLATAGFNASAFLPADPGQTSISGVVLDNQDRPLPGVTVRVDDSNRQALTNKEGRFTIPQAPVGNVHLLADGSTTTVDGEWPTLSYNLVTVPGVDNPLSSPIYLLRLDTEDAVYVGLEDRELTLAEVPGFKLEVPAGSVTFPDGAKEGYLSITPVNANKIPMPPPNGMQPQFIVTIQPHGAKFDPPARLTLPNVDGHLPGAEVEMYSYDHDLEEFVTIGLGTISPDGGVITSNPGIGVIKAGWHCGSQPGGSGCCEGGKECDYCEVAEGSCPVSCKFQPDKVAQKQVPGNCQKELCGGSSRDDGDKPPAECGICENGSPVIDEDKPLGADKQKPADCKELLCGGGFNPRDETAALQQDKGKECRVCKDGEEVNDENGRPCGDGSKEQACYTCKGDEISLPGIGKVGASTCGNHCSADPDTHELEYTAPQFVLEALTSFEKGVNNVPYFSSELKPAISVKATFGEMCCKNCENPGPRKYRKFSGSAGLKGNVKATIPNLGLIKNFPPKPVGGGFVIKVNIFVTLAGANIDVDVGGSVDYLDVDCPGENCGVFKLGGTVAGKIGPQFEGTASLATCDLTVNPKCDDGVNVISLEGKGNATVNFSVFVGATASSGAQCGPSCFGAQLEPVTASANFSVSLEILFKKYTYSHSFGSLTLHNGGAIGSPGCGS